MNYLIPSLDRSGSERDIVVEFITLRPRPTGGSLRVFGAWRGLASSPHAATPASTARTAAPAEHLHLVGDDLGGVAVAAFLVLPFAGAQPALDIDLRALAQVLGGDLAQAPEQRHVVPLGAFLLLAGLLVLPTLGGCEPHVGHRHARGHGPRLGISAQMTDKDDFVDAARHVLPLMPPDSYRQSPAHCACH